MSYWRRCAGGDSKRPQRTRRTKHTKAKGTTKDAATWIKPPAAPLRWSVSRIKRETQNARALLAASVHSRAVVVISRRQTHIRSTSFPSSSLSMPNRWRHRRWLSEVIGTNQLVRWCPRSKSAARLFLPPLGRDDRKRFALRLWWVLRQLPCCTEQQARSRRFGIAARRRQYRSLTDLLEQVLHVGRAFRRRLHVQDAIFLGVLVRFLRRTREF